MIEEHIMEAARAILTQIAYMKEYIRDLEQTSRAEDMTMHQLFDQFDTLLTEPQDRQFFVALRAYYEKECNHGN